LAFLTSKNGHTAPLAQGIQPTKIMIVNGIKILVFDFFRCFIFSGEKQTFVGPFLGEAFEFGQCNPQKIHGFLS